MSELNKVITDIGVAFEEFKQKNDARLAEIEKKGSADVVLSEQVDRISAEIDKIEEIKSRIEKAEVQLARRHTTSADNGDAEKKARMFADMCSKSRGVVAPSSFGVAELEAYKSGFAQYMRKGDLVSVEVQKALSVGVDPDGGYTVDPDTTGRIVARVFETSPMRQYASVQVIGTDSLEGLFDLNEASAGWVGETGSRAATDTPQIGKWRIPVHEVYANPAATQKVLDDSMLNLEQWLSDKVSDKFARMENAAFVTGTGVGQPRGFLTYASGTTLPGTIQRVKSGASGAFLTDGTAANRVIDLVYAMKQEYRTNARFFMPREVVAGVRKIKDADGNYVWAPGMAAGQPSTLLGYQVVEMSDMPALGANSLSMAFGNMAEAYQIVDRNGVRVLRDPYSNKPYVNFYSVKRTGGDVVNFEAIKLMEFITD